jgi:hypothetical protein
MTLTINGKHRNDGSKQEDFSQSEDPITGAPIEPEQLELKPKPKKKGQFTKNAEALIGRSGKKLRGGGDAD